MTPRTIALFGESEKGEYRTPHYCTSLPQLVDKLGNPPPESKGLFLAVQSLMYEHALLFFRVKEEGFSLSDYFRGINILKDRTLDISAVCTPGCGDQELIDELAGLCEFHQSILMTTEADLYDYLTN